MFGEKDYQQLKVVTALASDLDLPVKIVGVPTVREPDGLALSSRNGYLNAVERAAAPTLHRVLAHCSGEIARGQLLARVLDEGGTEIERAGFALDYLEARHADTLQRVASLKDGPMRLLVAARIGRTRLIDNMAVSRGRTARGTKAAPAECGNDCRALGLMSPGAQLRPDIAHFFTFSGSLTSSNLANSVFHNSPFSFSTLRM